MIASNMNYLHKFGYLHIFRHSSKLRQNYRCGICGKYLASKSLNSTILVLICENCLAAPSISVQWKEVQNIKFWLKHFPKSKEAYFTRFKYIIFFPAVEEYLCHQATDRFFFFQFEYSLFKNVNLEMFLYQKPPEQGLHLVNTTQTSSHSVLSWK